VAERDELSFFYPFVCFDRFESSSDDAVRLKEYSRLVFLWTRLATSSAHY
jgi:hypothetical protein